MARPREFDEKKAIHDALQLFWEKGYEATSITDLTERMGISRPSLYAAFGDKRGLFLLAIDAYLHNYISQLEGILNRSGSGLRGIEAVFERFVQSTREPESRRGCLFVNSIAELAGQDEFIAEKGRQFQKKVSKMFADALEHGKKNGELPQALEVQGAAHFLTMAVTGLQLAVKTGPEASFIQNCVCVVLGALK